MTEQSEHCNLTDQEQTFDSQENISNPEQNELPSSSQENQIESPPSTNEDQTVIGGGSLRAWLNRSLRIQLTDGRTIVGVFLCTDNHPNIILGSSREYWLNSDGKLDPGEEARTIGLTMIPAKEIVNICVIDDDNN